LRSEHFGDAGAHVDRRARTSTNLARMLRLFAPLAILASALALLVGASAASAAPTSLLYVQQTAAGSLTRTAHGWRLVLRDPSPEITTFADRPARIGGSLSLASFVRRWHTEFHSVAPNAALEISAAPANRNIALIELGTPHGDVGRNTVTFDVKPLTRTSATRLQTLARGADPLRTTSFGRATLFIDDGTSMQFPFSMTVGGTQIGSGFTLTFDQAQLSFSAMFQSTFISGQAMTYDYSQNTIYGSPINTAGPATSWSGNAVGYLATIGGQPVTGEAVLQPGMTVALQIGTGPQTTISSSGRFSIPIS